MNSAQEAAVPDVDPQELLEFGSLLTDGERRNRLAPAFEREELVRDVLQHVQQGATRAVLLVGPSGAGKTALVQETARRLADRHWHVLEVAPTDFMRGTRYLGEWETRLSRLVEAAKVPRPVVLYLANLEILSSVGRSSGSDTNVADSLAPFLARGELSIIGECTEEQLRQGGGVPAGLRRLFHIIKVSSFDAGTTRRVLQRVAGDSGIQVSDPVLDRLLELSEFYGSPAELPGRAVDLLRKSLENLEGDPPQLREGDILAAIRRRTGIPTSLLDDSLRLDRGAVQQFFESRVMGQPEAVNAAVDFVTLIKAGLSDPQKPLGVLLFVGPTGVGKTELARTLAEYCFGDSRRLTRLDMTEFATYDAQFRLLGPRGEEGLLTTVVREQPFSIILLDEIEKAHPLVFDLCLQMFDAGRLSDGRGQVADFRRSLIILTSNIGSAAYQEPPIGFQDALDTRALHSNLRKYARREMSRFFRPEFLNRIDRIVHFAPLDQETAERIAQRELTAVLQRGGIRRRQIAVEVDPGVIPVLLQEGYSQTFGARPLKRTLERLVLLPLARAIASGKAPRGSQVRISAVGNAIRLRVERGDEPDELLAPPTKVPATIGVPLERVERLRQCLEELWGPIEALAGRKTQLLAQAGGAEGSRAGMHAVYDEIYRLDGLAQRHEHLATGLGRLEESIRQRRVSRAASIRQLETLEELELDGRFLHALLRGPTTRSLDDAVLTLSLLDVRGGQLRGVELLAKMYRELARQQRFEVEVLDDRCSAAPLLDTVTLLIEGAGAYYLLAAESGRHLVSQGRDERTKREMVRVQVLPVPALTAPSLEDVSSEVRRLRDAGQRLGKRRFEVKLRHRPTLVSVQAWTDCERERAVRRILPLLMARVRSVQEAEAPKTPSDDDIVRRYRLGPDPLVRDARSGLRWGRLDRVLRGALHRFLLRTPPSCITADPVSVEH